MPTSDIRDTPVEEFYEEPYTEPIKVKDRDTPVEEFYEEPYPEPITV